MIRRSTPCQRGAGELDRVLQKGPGNSPAAVYGTAPRTAHVRMGITAFGSLLVLAACGTDSDATERTPPTSSPFETSAALTNSSPPVDPDEAAAADAAMAVYRDLVRLVQDSRRDPTQDWLPAYTQLTAETANPAVRADPRAPCRHRALDGHGRETQPRARFTAWRPTAAARERPRPAGRRHRSSAAGAGRGGQAPPRRR